MFTVYLLSTITIVIVLYRVYTLLREGFKTNPQSRLMFECLIFLQQHKHIKVGLRHHFSCTCTGIYKQIFLPKS